MKPGGLDSDPWSARRWIIALALVVAIQVAILFLVPQPAPIAPRSALRATVIKFDPAGAKSGWAGWAPTWQDPTLFSTIHPHGFSGHAWLNYPRREYRLKDWTEPASWLQEDTSRFGVGFTQFVNTVISSQPSPLASGQAGPWTIDGLKIPPTTLATNSSVRIVGDLAGRGLLRAIEPPPIASEEILTNSVVEVAVRPDGYTFSVRLVSPGARGAEQKTADQIALNLAKAARFEPRPSGATNFVSATPPALTYGSLIFAWRVLEPPVAGGLPGKP